MWHDLSLIHDSIPSCTLSQHHALSVSVSPFDFLLPVEFIAITCQTLQWGLGGVGHCSGACGCRPLQWGLWVSATVQWGWWGVGHCAVGPGRLQWGLWVSATVQWGLGGGATVPGANCGGACMNIIG